MVRMPPHAVAVVVHEELAAPGFEEAEEVDERRHRKCRILTPAIAVDYNTLLSDSGS